MLDMTMGSGVAIASVCLAVPATVKIIVSSKRPAKEDKATNGVLLEIIKKLNLTIEKKVETDYEMMKNLIEMNTTAKSTHFKVNETLDIVKMTEKNTKEITNDTDKIKETVAEVRLTQRSIDKRIK